jgi:hypothetical protein
MKGTLLKKDMPNIGPAATVAQLWLPLGPFLVLALHPA